jgi:hypothetical protein
MPTSAKNKVAKEFFVLDRGRQDAELHEDILADGNDAAAKKVSDAVKARLQKKRPKR